MKEHFRAKTNQGSSFMPVVRSHTLWANKAIQNAVETGNSSGEKMARDLTAGFKLALS